MVKEKPIKGIWQFEGKHRFLSNFYPAQVCYEEQWYPAVEHAYQAAKTLDKDIRLAIAGLEKAGDAKRYGNGHKVQLREDWETIKLHLMYGLVMQKFIRHRELATMLLSTGDSYLEEGNYWRDTYWGVCNGVGYNHLGLILMDVRHHVRVFYRDRLLFQ